MEEPRSTNLKVTTLYLKFINQLSGLAVEHEGKTAFYNSDMVMAFEKALRPDIEKMNDKLKDLQDTINDKDRRIRNLEEQLIKKK